MINKGKYAKIPKSIPKSNPSFGSNTDGDAVHVRTFEWSASPFRSDLNGSGSIKRTVYMPYNKAMTSTMTTSMNNRPLSKMDL